MNIQIQDEEETLSLAELDRREKNRRSVRQNSSTLSYDKSEMRPCRYITTDQRAPSPEDFSRPTKTPQQEPLLNPMS